MMSAEAQPGKQPVGQEDRFTVPLETGKRLSASVIWQAQRSYFEHAGIDAWRTQTVPHYVTNNPRLAASYAEVVLGFLRDFYASGGISSDVDQPLYIVELGAGCGRFGYFFLKTLQELLRRSALPPVDFRYVMTDFTESNLAFLRAHEAMQAFAEKGILDFGRFDVESDDQIKLERSGKTLSPGSLRNPVVVIANYVFDGVPQDAFRVQENQLFERLISIYSDIVSPDLSVPGVFEHLAVLYGDQVAPPECYPESEFNTILQHYAQTLEGTTFLFPCTALRCVQRLSALSGGRMLLLSGDKGEGDPDSIGSAPNPAFTMHGSFSMIVNFHALSEYFFGQGGQALAPEGGYRGINVSAFLLGLGGDTTRETRLAYELAIGGGAADDFFVLRQGMKEHYNKLEVKHLLALLRLSRFDPRIMRDCLPALWAQLEAATTQAKKEIAATVLRVWENYFHLGEEHDLAFDLASLLYGLGEYEAALGLFEESCRLYGADPRTLWNLGLCYCGMGRVQEAAECFSRSLQTAGEFRPEGSLQEKDLE